MTTRHFALGRRDEERVVPLELLLDVVFVLAISQCTALMVEEGSWAGLASGLVILAVLWRGWTGFAWLTSSVDPNSIAVRLVIFAAMGSFVVMALAIPRAFGDLATEFVVSYAAIRLIHMTLGYFASRDDAEFRSTVQRNAIGGGIAVVLLALGTVIDGPAGYACWILAVLADFLVAATFSRVEWRLVAGHFAERHALIMIIALGESILAIGIGAKIADVSAPTLALALVGVALVASLWWTYFDGVSVEAEHRLVAATPGREQNGLARLAYSLLHLPMVAGDVLLALGIKYSIAHPDHPLEPYAAGAFFGGLAMYLLGNVAFGWRMTGRLNVLRLVVALVLVALIPVGASIPAAASLIVATAIMVILVAAQRMTRQVTSADAA